MTINLRRNYRGLRVAAAAVVLFASQVLLGSYASTADATDSNSGAAADAKDDNAIALKLQNPVANLISVPLQNNWDYGIGPKDSEKYQLNVQPVIPISLGENYNLITRTIVPFLSAQSPAIGLSDQTGMGDILQSFFLSPKAPVEGWILGGGPVLSYPTASRDALGSGKWGAGPTAVILKQIGGWTVGMLGNHVWSYAGEANRPDVNSTFLQPFLSYTTTTHTTIGLNTESTYSWESSEWNVPLNLTLAQVLKVGSQPIQLSAGVRDYVSAPDGGPTWGLRFALTFLFPR